MYTVSHLQANGLILLECVSGSRAYGLHSDTSDWDIRGVYCMPLLDYYGLEYQPQIAEDNNNTVFYELKRFTELLLRCNPTALELLATPQDCVRYRHPALAGYTPTLFLSKKCKDTFSGYALEQIRKAQGLNKKIHNPVEPERKSALNFCYIISDGQTQPLLRWLEANGARPENCGLTSLAHARDLYALYLGTTGQYRGILPNPDSTMLAMSSVATGLLPKAYLWYNKDGYSQHCKEYRAYWDWVENRNPDRYETNVAHSRNYDSKNMMHTFRLLYVALDIAQTGELQLRSTRRDLLLDIKQGRYTYEDLMQMSDTLVAEIDAAYTNCGLPDEPDAREINHLLAETRKLVYS